MGQLIADAHFAKYTTALEAAGKDAGQRKVREANKKFSRAAKDALGAASRTGSKSLIGMAGVYITRSHLISGNYNKALKSSEEAVEVLNDANDRPQGAIAMAVNAEALMFLKEREKAETIAKKAMWMAQGVRDARAENYAKAVLNAIYEAEKAAQTALPAAPTA